MTGLLSTLVYTAIIGRAKADSVVNATYGVTLLDVSVQAALSFLDALVMHEQVAVAEANVERFAEFSKVVHAQVNAGLQPGANPGRRTRKLRQCQK